MSQAAAALRHMSQARHIGKIVLSLEHEHITPVQAPEDKPLQLRPDATYLITGGLGGFGLCGRRVGWLRGWSPARPRPRRHRWRRRQAI
jgi:hypothetical protein